MSTSSQSNDQPIAPLMPEREQHIRARVEAATEGPWGRDAARGPYFRADSPAGEFGTVVGDVHFGCGVQAAADWEFTAHAREDVPALLAEIDRLRTDLADTRAHALNEAADRIQARAGQLGGVWLRTDQVCGGLRSMAESTVKAPRTEWSYWVAIAAALNDALDANMPVSIDLDGTLTDHDTWSVIWDRTTERWAVAAYENDDTAESEEAAR